MKNERERFIKTFKKVTFIVSNSSEKRETSTSFSNAEEFKLALNKFATLQKGMTVKNDENIKRIYIFNDAKKGKGYLYHMNCIVSAGMGMISYVEDLIFLADSKEYDKGLKDLAEIKRMNTIDSVVKYQKPITWEKDDNGKIVIYDALN